MRKVLLFVALFLPFCSFSQDTIRFLQQNLLYYGVTFQTCTDETDSRNVYLKTIVDYVKPDIFAANEVSSNSSKQLSILNDVLNAGGSSDFSQASLTNYAGSNIVNPLYYNHNKLGLASYTGIHTDTRDVNVYKLYHKTADLATGADTIYITCLVAHLKAGSTDADDTARAIQTDSIMAFLQRTMIGSQNYFLMGDLNIYQSNDAAFQHLISTPDANIRFYDPINKLGTWNNNAAFALYHTQSTNCPRPCSATGGMDDRFDWILVSNAIKYGTKNILCLPSTYKAVGQDGLLFNQSFTTSTIVPPQVADALYNMSDHLPVTMDVVISRSLGVRSWSADDYSPDIGYILYENGRLMYEIDVKEPGDHQIRVLSMQGRVVAEEISDFQKGSHVGITDLPSLSPGLYFLSIAGYDGSLCVKKFFIK